jgi:hypothetical protein
MDKQVKDKFKVIKLENGKYDYDTVFIEVNKKVIQIPIEKDAIKEKQIIGKTILIPCELIGENEYLFNKEINKVEFV